jgi:plastocyanin
MNPTHVLNLNYQRARQFAVAALLVTTLLALGRTALAGKIHIYVTEGAGTTHFDPLHPTIEVGDTVEWIWGDNHPHSATSGKGATGKKDGVFDSGIHSPPHTFSFTFNTAGKYDYFCAQHRALNQANIWPYIEVVAPSATRAQPLNVSTRLRVQSGQNAMIGGFIITGNAPKRVIVRAVGPSLGNAGVTGALQDPTIELNGPGGAIASNDNWRDNQQGDIEASGVRPSDNRESAIVATLAPGNYTAVMQGKDGTTGVGLVEVYDLDQNADSLLANISTRGVVETGGNVMIGGFILGKSDGAANVIVRAIGPTLGESGVQGVLADPTLELRNGSGEVVRSNNNWRDSQQAEIQATGIPPQHDVESAVVATLPPGAYTAIVAGNGGGTGIGLVEAYRLQ